MPYLCNYCTEQAGNKHLQIYWLDTIGKTSIALVSSVKRPRNYLFQGSVSLTPLFENEHGRLRYGHAILNSRLDSSLLDFRLAIETTQGLLLKSQNKTYDEVVSIDDKVPSNPWGNKCVGEQVLSVSLCDL